MVITSAANKPHNSTGPASSSAPKLVPPQKKLDKPRLRVLVRNIPPNMTQDEFLKSIHLPPSTYTYLKFCRGDATFGAQRVCRAYLRFNHPHEVMVFNKKVDGTWLEDKQGIRKQLIVEFAPLQKLPLPAKRKDKLDGTIDNDITFKQFVLTLEQQKQTEDDSTNTEANPGNTIERVLKHLEEREKERKKYLTGEVLTPLMQSLLVGGKKDAEKRNLKPSRERIPVGERSTSKNSSRSLGKSEKTSAATSKDASKTAKPVEKSVTAFEAAKKLKKERSVKDADKYYQHARSYQQQSHATSDYIEPEHAQQKYYAETSVKSGYKAVVEPKKPPMSIQKSTTEKTPTDSRPQAQQQQQQQKVRNYDRNNNNRYDERPYIPSNTRVGDYDDEADAQNGYKTRWPGSKSSTPSQFAGVSATKSRVAEKLTAAASSSPAKRNDDNYDENFGKSYGLKSRPSVPVYKPPPPPTTTANNINKAKDNFASESSTAPSKAGSTKNRSEQPRAKPTKDFSAADENNYRRSAYHSNDYYDSYENGNDSKYGNSSGGGTTSGGGGSRAKNVSSSTYANNNEALFPEEESSWQSPSTTTSTFAEQNSRKAPQPPRKDRVFTSKSRNRTEYY